MDFHREKVVTLHLEAGILLTYNAGCPRWKKIYRRNWEDLNIVLMSKSANKAYTLRDVAGKQLGRVRYFLGAHGLRESL